MRQNYLKVENGFQFESPGAGRCGCALVAPEKQRGFGGFGDLCAGKSGRRV